MSASGGVLAAPFGGISLSELRASVSAGRRTERSFGLLAEVDPSSWDEPRGEVPGFDDVLMAGVPYDDEGWALSDEQEGSSVRPLATSRLAFGLMIGVGFPAALGAVILLGLLWSTWTGATPPEWLPEQLWTDPWSRTASK